MTKAKIKPKEIFLARYLPPHQVHALEDIVARKRLPLSALLSMLIDNELEKEDPFHYDMTLPEETEDGVHAETGGIFLNYMTGNPRGMSLDRLLTYRHEMGIESKEALLYVISHCLKTKLIEQVEPPERRGGLLWPDGHCYYRRAGIKSGRSNKMKAKDFNTYLRLKKKFEDENGELK